MEDALHLADPSQVDELLRAIRHVSIVDDNQSGITLDGAEVALLAAMLRPNERYELFHFADYYPGGGWNDRIKGFPSVAAAIAWLETPEAAAIERDACTGVSWHLIDRLTGQRVAAEDRALWVGYHSAGEDD